MSFLNRIFSRRRERRALAPLYRGIVATARDPFWYRDGQVPDTIDGRFDMVAAVLALVLLRLEREGEAARGASVRLTESFIDDMDGTLRQIGIGDHVVGKHVGRMIGALGGRLAAFRDAESDPDAFSAAVLRNVFHETPPVQPAADAAVERLARLRDALAAADCRDLLAGKLP